MSRCIAQLNTPTLTHPIFCTWRAEGNLEALDIAEEMKVIGNSLRNPSATIWRPGAPGSLTRKAYQISDDNDDADDEADTIYYQLTHYRKKRSSYSIQNNKHASAFKCWLYKCDTTVINYIGE